MCANEEWRLGVRVRVAHIMNMKYLKILKCECTNVLFIWVVLFYCMLEYRFKNRVVLSWSLWSRNAPNHCARLILLHLPRRLVKLRRKPALKSRWWFNHAKSKMYQKWLRYACKPRIKASLTLRLQVREARLTNNTRPSSFKRAFDLFLPTSTAKLNHRFKVLTQKGSRFRRTRRYHR